MRSINTSITAAAGLEVSVDVFTSPEDKPRTVKMLAIEQVDGAVIRGYMAQDRILEVSTDADVIKQQYIPVEEKFAVGETWKVALYNPTGGSLTAEITTFYTEGE